MRTKEERRTCDCCGKDAVADLDNPTIGGHPFHGWFEIQQHGGSTQLAQLKKKRNWDLCGEECLRKTFPFANDFY